MCMYQRLKPLFAQKNDSNSYQIKLSKERRTDANTNYNILGNNTITISSLWKYSQPFLSEITKLI